MSPHGLGLSRKAFWDLTPREYYALEDVQQAEAKRWAVQMATMVNMELVGGSVPFTPDDFLGRGDREKRVQEKQVADLLVQKVNRQLTMALPRAQRKGEPEPENLPLWARKNPVPQVDSNGVN